MRRYIWCAVLTAALTAVVAVRVAAFRNERATDPAPLAFLVPSEGGEQSIACWTEDEENYYAFLPSYTELDQVRVRTDEELAVGGIPLADGASCGGFSLNEAYPLSLGKRTGSLRFLRSANVGTVFMETQSGNMNYIHKDKNHRETVRVAAYTAEGTLNYSSEGSDTLNGRGNSTWNRLKKPYNLHLSEPAELLGLPRGKKWCLLANVYDASNLRNWIVYTMAGRVGFSWSPDVTFTDVYLNGEYNGLYLLVEAIEVEEGRLNLSEDGCLLGLDYRGRLNFEEDPAFETGLFQTVEINYPALPSKEQMEEIEAHVAAMENAMTSPESVDPGTGKSLRELIDLDSWVRKYLIEEISENLDSGITSQYFYFDRDENGFLPICAGPVWDYDLTMANKGWERIQEPRSLYAAQTRVGNTNRPWYGLLYQKPEFYKRVAELYRQEFLPLLEEYLSSGIAQKAVGISSASLMNEVRWRCAREEIDEGSGSAKAWKEGKEISWADDVARVQKFLAERMEFLTDLWLEGGRYCTIAMTDEDGQDRYQYCSVKYGQVWEDMPAPEDVELTGAVWRVYETGEVFDARAPVTSDMLLMAPKPVEPGDEAFSFLKTVGRYGFPLLLLMALGGLFLADRARYHEKGR